MGVELDKNPTLDKCDKEFESLSVKFQTMDRKDVLQPAGSNDPSIKSVGAVLAEAVSAAWWSDYLCFYELALAMMRMYLDSGPYPQSGMAFLHLSMVALARFNMIQFAKNQSNNTQKQQDRFRDPFSMAWGY